MEGVMRTLLGLLVLLFATPTLAAECTATGEVQNGHAIFHTDTKSCALIVYYIQGEATVLTVANGSGGSDHLFSFYEDQCKEQGSDSSEPCPKLTVESCTPCGGH
jgi:hypothetical protein